MTQTVSFWLKYLPHEAPINSLKPECDGLRCLNSTAVQKHFRHSQQTYSFTTWWRTCSFSSLWL